MERERERVKGTGKRSEKDKREGKRSEERE